MASALWVIKRCHLVSEKTFNTLAYLITGAIRTYFNLEVYGLTFSDLRLWVPSAHRSGARSQTWIGQRRTCYLVGESDTDRLVRGSTGILLHMHQSLTFVMLSI